jgi:hypothetical protein
VKAGWKSSGWQGDFPSRGEFPIRQIEHENAVFAPSGNTNPFPIRSERHAHPAFGDWNSLRDRRGFQIDERDEVGGVTVARHQHLRRSRDRQELERHTTKLHLPSGWRERPSVGKLYRGRRPIFCVRKHDADDEETNCES